MNNSKIEEASCELLREAKKSRNQLCKMKNGSDSFVRCKHSYVEPEERRTLYLAAFDSLCLDGKLKKVLENDIFEVYELDQEGYGVKLTVTDAMESLTDGLTRYGQLYKIHSREGEFIQCAGTTYMNQDDERIIYLEAVYRLMHRGLIQVVSDSKQFAIYELCAGAYKAH